MNDKDLEGKIVLDLDVYSEMTSYLSNYAGDLSYQVGEGASFVNFCSSGTPYFAEKKDDEGDGEAQEYLDGLESLIQRLPQEDSK